MIETGWEKINIMASHSSILQVHCNKQDACSRLPSGSLKEALEGRAKSAVERLEGLKQNRRRRETSAF